MTISSEVRIAGPYTGNGTTTNFAFTFKVFAASEILVVKQTIATGVESTLILTTDYTVSLNANQDTAPGGSITTVGAGSPLTSASKIVITSQVPNTQGTDLTNQGGFYPDVINDALDRATIQVQQLSDMHNRTISVPVSDAVISLELPAAAQRVNTIMGFNAVGSPIVTTQGGITSGNTSILGTLGVTGAATLSTTLGVTGATTLSSTATVGGTLGVTGATTLSSTLSVVGNTTLTGDVAVNGGDVTTSAGTASVFNTNATTLNVGGAATAVNIGAATGTTAIANSATVAGTLGVTSAATISGALNVNSSEIATTTTGTVNLLNTNATTLNVGGAATTLSMGASTGTASINNATFRFNSGFGSVATAYGCRAWARYNGINDALNASGGVTSISRTAIGTYTIALSTSMTDVNYAVCATASSSLIANAQTAYFKHGTNTNSNFEVFTAFGGSTTIGTNSGSLGIAVFR